MFRLLIIEKMYEQGTKLGKNNIQILKSSQNIKAESGSGENYANLDPQYYSNSTRKNRIFFHNLYSPDGAFKKEKV